MPLTVCEDAGSVPPWQGELVNVTVRVCVRVSSSQTVAGDGDQDPVLHRHWGRQFIVPLTGCEDAGAVPPSQGELSRLTCRVRVPVPPRQMAAGLSPVQGPVDHRQVGREQSIVPDTVRLEDGRVPPAQG